MICMGFVNVDVLDRRIIHALYVDPRAPFSRLAEVLGSSEPTVSRRYRRLFDNRILRVVGQLDSQRVGQYDWAVRIRCAPGSAPTVAAKLAQHPDTSWVQLTSGGTEIFSMIHSRDGEQRTPLLLSQLSVGRQGVALEAYCLLHLFATGLSAPPGPSDLSHGEIAQLLPPARDRPSIDRPTAKLQDSDRALVQALADDGRSPYRQLAARTHWHESTVRRRVEELIASGVLFFDLDLASDAFGIRSQALLWMSVAPTNVRDVGQALASRPEFPFVAATTGSTNLVAALVCPDDSSLFEYLADEMTTFDGLTHIETAPVMQFVKMHATMAPQQP
jgi:DNA-binding Lrp family transcriptional regulator